MNDIPNRIKQLRQAEGLTVKEFAAKIGENENRMRSIELRKQRTPADTLVKIICTFHINANWLLIDKGNIYLKKDSTTALNPLIKWLNEWWENADEEHQIWLKVQMTRCFPEYEEWLNQKKNDS